MNMANKIKIFTDRASKYEAELDEITNRSRKLIQQISSKVLEFVQNQLKKEHKENQDRIEYVEYLSSLRKLEDTLIEVELSIHKITSEMRNALDIWKYVTSISWDQFNDEQQGMLSSKSIEQSQIIMQNIILVEVKLEKLSALNHSIEGYLEWGASLFSNELLNTAPNQESLITKDEEFQLCLDQKIFINVYADGYLLCSKGELENYSDEIVKVNQVVYPRYTTMFELHRLH